MNKDEMSTFGVTPEEILGPKDSWTDENAWNEASKNLESFKVEKITINSDNTKSV
jgi:ATP-dependent phosphoenolpyruvate carboxykinase